jgi:ATP-dependent DNA ligase
MKPDLNISLASAKTKRVVPWNDTLYVAEEKLDGWRFAMHLGGDLSRMHLTGRRTSVKTGHLSEKGLNVKTLLPRISPEKYTVFDGELCSPRKFEDIAGIMNVDPIDAEKRIKEIGMPVYHIFDILIHEGEDLREWSMMERRFKLESLRSVIETDHIKIVDQRPATEDFFAEVISRDGEGLIIKDRTAEYGFGWFKVKKESTVDVVVTGFTDAKFGRTGKYDGLIGAVNVSVYSKDGDLLEVGRVSGMDDDLRRSMSSNKGEWLGRVIEIAAQGWAKYRLRHPRFVRARPDKDPRSCTYRAMKSSLGLDHIVDDKNDGQLTLDSILSR